MRPARGGSPRLPASSLKRIYRDVDWSLSYIAFLVYLVIVITYRFPGASIAIGVALGGLILEKRRPRLPFWLVGFAAFVLWGAASYTQSDFRTIAWEEGFLEFGKLWLICLVAANVLTSQARIRFFLVFLLLLYATHPIRGALFNTFVYGYTYQNTSRVVWNGAWGNPNDMAALTFLPLGIAAGLLKDANLWVRRGAIASVAVMPFVVLLTQSRGAFLGIGVLAMLTVLAHRKQARAMVGVFLLGSAAVLFAPAGTFARFGDLTSAVRERDLTAANDMGSAAQRWEIWGVAQRIITDHPVFGVGMSAYNWAHGAYTYYSAETMTAGGRRDVHSTFLRVLAETGYPGLVLFLIPFVMALSRSRRYRLAYGARFPTQATRLKYLEASLYAFFVVAIFGSYAHQIFVWLHLATLGIVAEGLRQTASRESREAIASTAFPRAAKRRWSRPVGAAP